MRLPHMWVDKTREVDIKAYLVVQEVLYNRSKYNQDTKHLTVVRGARK